MTSEVSGEEFFEPSSTVDSVSSDPEYEGSNVCRAGALSSLLQQKRDVLRDLATEQRALGFSEQIIESGIGSHRQSMFDGNRVDTFTLREGDLDSDRRRLWEQVNESTDRWSAVGFLAAMLGSSLEREATAAAAALWRGLELAARSPQPQYWFIDDDPVHDSRYLDVFADAPWFPLGWDRAIPSDDGLIGGIDWDPKSWQHFFSRAMEAFGWSVPMDESDPAVIPIAVLVRVRLGGALRSTDEVVRSLAFAALGFPDDSASSLPGSRSSLSAPIPGALVVSTMIHGTWGWKGEWWRPQEGPFHSYILQNHRPNLYSRGAKFSWSGAYSDNQRAIAARDFVEWAYDVAPHGIQSVFAHSYGGEVAARAAVAGARIHELVLLSTPATKHVYAAAESGLRIVDIRLRFDPVLAIAGTRQRIAPRANVQEVLLSRWTLRHGATHDESVWRGEDIARRGRL